MILPLLLSAVGTPVLAYDFETVSTSRGFNYSGNPGDNNQITIPSFIDNTGVFTADVTNNSYPDILALGNDKPELFLNRGGHFDRSKKFPDVDRKLSSALFVDYNADRFKDLVLVPRNGKLLLFHNDNGHFRNPKKIPSPSLTAGSGATAGDFNADGCPDLFVYQSIKDYQSRPSRHLEYRLGQASGGTELSEAGRRNFFLTGTCSGFRWKESSRDTVAHSSLAASAADLTGNNRLDVHVANDFHRDSLYVNQGNGNFRHRYLSEDTNRNGMASLLWDVDRNALPDIFVSNIFLSDTNPAFNWSTFKTIMTHRPFGHNLLINEGGGKFSSEEKAYGVRGGGWGWAASSADFNNSGWMELLQARQNFITRRATMPVFNLEDSEFVSYLTELFDGSTPGHEVQKNKFYPFIRDWLGYPGFWSRTSPGPFRARPDVEQSFGRWDARGLVTLDYNMNGLEDLVITDWDGRYGLMENQLAEKSRHDNWIKVFVRSPKLYQGGFLRLQTGKRVQLRPLSAQSGYHSQEAAIYHFGLGESVDESSLRVEWNDGSVQ
ncbi:MAG: CRTAC1 family protein, partial [bacterium]